MPSGGAAAGAASSGGGDGKGEKPGNSNAVGASYASAVKGDEPAGSSSSN